jgi:hypothetical protein
MLKIEKLEVKNSRLRKEVITLTHDRNEADKEAREKQFLTNIK